MTFKIYTLGCKVNTYESSVMQDKLINAGFTLSDELPNITIINTCTVTNTADSKSRKMINRARKENPNTILVVTGCMSQKNEKIEDVDIKLGNVGKSKIVEYINEYLKNKEQISDIKDVMHCHFEPMVLNNFDRTRAFVKIQDGCNNFCSYCIIPYVRGNVRSKAKDDVLNEINTLVNDGHKEIVLTGIHTGHYGEDNDKYKFPDLLKDIVKIDGLERLRISSIEITELNQEFLEVLKENKILVDHMHIPLQSGSDNILKKMNRKYDKKYFIDKIEEIRNIRPDISITTDIITGFPGETEEEENETIETITKIKFSKIHVFPYSRRKGTEADLMENQISEDIKKKRVKTLLELSKNLESEYANKFIGRDVIFIPEVYKDGYLIGHTGNYLLVKMKGDKELLNKDVKVKLIEENYPYVIGGEK